MRKLSQGEVMATVLNNWHQREYPAGFEPSVRRTAWFLWVMVVGLLILGGLATIVALFPKAKEHCDHGTGTGAHVECAQELQAQVSGEGQDVGHGGMVTAPTLQEYVHGRPA